MSPFILIFILALIGAIETIYLIRKRMASEAPICPMGGDCGMVLGSKYNRIFYFHNDVMGLFSLIVIALVAVLLMLEIGPTSLFGLILKILIAATSIMSVFFTYLQWRVIKKWCFWCLMSACTVWLMGIILLIS